MYDDVWMYSYTCTFFLLISPVFLSLFGFNWLISIGPDICEFQFIHYLFGKMTGFTIGGNCFEDMQSRSVVWPSEVNDIIRHHSNRYSCKHDQDHVEFSRNSHFLGLISNQLHTDIHAIVSYIHMFSLQVSYETNHPPAFSPLMPLVAHWLLWSWLRNGAEENLGAIFGGKGSGCADGRFQPHMFLGRFKEHLDQSPYWNKYITGWWFEIFVFSPLPGEDSHVD